MIKLQNYTPEIYYKESRDFQFIGRLYDLVLNSVKTEVDLLYNLPLSTNSDEKLLELLSMTLGFKPRRQYNARQLKAICSVFSEILKHKGSIKALKIACEALFNAMDIDQALDYDFTQSIDKTDKTDLNLYISEDFEDISILYDLLTYVLPAGMSCNIIRELRLNTTSLTELGLTNTVTLNKISDSETAYIADLSRTDINYNAANSTTADTSSDAEGLQVLPGFSINSEIVKLEETNKNG